MRAEMISDRSVQYIIPREDLKARKFQAVSLLYVRSKIRSLSGVDNMQPPHFLGLMRTVLN